MVKSLFAVIAIFLCGCMSQIVSFDDGTKHWIGRPVSQKKEILARPTSYASSLGWKEVEYRLATGNTIFVEPIRADCYVHWEVDPKGIIIGLQAVGKRCY